MVLVRDVDIRRNPTGGHALCLLGLLAALQPAFAGVAPGQAEGPLNAVTVSSIKIRNGNVFDLERPDENKALFRFANRAHAVTRPKLIEQQLLFEEGAPLTRQAVEESERILRANRYIQEAAIHTTRNDDGTVDVLVRTTDTWTLMPKFALSRSGGRNSAAVGIKELNLLGTGVELEAMRRSEVERDSTSLKLVDRHLFGSWYSLSALVAENSDGHERQFDFGLPFYSLRSTRAFGLAGLDDDLVESVYDSGVVESRYRHRAQRLQAFHGWSAGLQDGWATRWVAGAAYEQHAYEVLADETAPPADMPAGRTLVYPFVGVEIIEDRYEKAANIEQISRTEDRFLGTRFNAKLGYAAAPFGSDRDAWVVQAGAQTGFGESSGRSLLLRADLGTRVEAGGVQNMMLSLAADYYRRQSEHRLFYAGISGTYGLKLDIDNPLELGGENGLRGYPYRYRSGDSVAQLTLEQRFFTDWYPFRLFRVGGAVFFDAGKVWNDRPGQDDVLRNVGVGLRLGNSRSGLGRMTHIDIAYPVDGDQSISSLQFLVETRKSF